MGLFALTKTVIKSVLRRPATIKYPFGPKRPYYKGARGSIKQDITKCIFCGLCEKKCPTGALSVNRDKKEWTIDRLRCITCGYCTEICPKKCLTMEPDYKPPVTGRKKETYKNT